MSSLGNKKKAESKVEMAETVLKNYGNWVAACTSKFLSLMSILLNSGRILGVLGGARRVLLRGNTDIFTLLLRK